MTGNFFSVGTHEWASACQLGLNPAVAFLVLARGTGRDNVTTRWSADAISRYTGMTWRRAVRALSALEHVGLAINVAEQGRRPIRKLAAPQDLDGALWLPNTLVTGAGSESPPITRLRQAQNVEHLQAFIELYGLHDLAGDGGLPRSLVRTPFNSKPLYEIGQFMLHGFESIDTRLCEEIGPLARFANRREGNKPASWTFLRTLEHMGLLETVDYLAEGDSVDAELLHPLSGDDEANKVLEAASLVVDSLPDGLRHEAEAWQYALPVIQHIAKPAVVGVSRLLYRPHTKLTAAWYAKHKKSCTRHVEIYAAIAENDFKRAMVQLQTSR